MSIEFFIRNYTVSMINHEQLPTPRIKSWVPDLFGALRTHIYPGVNLLESVAFMQILNAIAVLHHRIKERI